MSNLDSRNKLTEFRPFEPSSEDQPEENIKFSFSKWIWWKKSSGEVPDLDRNESNNINTKVAFYKSEQCSSDDNLAGETRSLGPGVLPKENVHHHRHVNARSVSTVPSPELKRHHGGRKLSVSLKTNLNRSESSLSNLSPELLEGNNSPYEARTLPNVLRRISNLIAMGSNNQNDIRKYWMPDSVSKECYECAEKFTTFRRKHHCRICGQIFCSRCCSQEIPGKIIGYSGDLRVCTYCCKIVLSYLNSTDLNADCTNEHRLVQEDLQNRFGGSGGNDYMFGGYHSLSVEHIASYRSLPRRRASLVYQEERFVGPQNQDNSSEFFEADTVKCDWVALKTLFDAMCNPVSGVDWSTHRHNMMKNYSECAVGSELVDWLLAQRKISWRGQGVQIGQLLIDVNLIECVSQAEQVFLDAYALYRPVNTPISSVLEDIPESSQSTRSSADFSSTTSHHDPLWMKQIKVSRLTDNVFDESQESSLNDGVDSSISNIPTTSCTSDANSEQNFVVITKVKGRDHVDPYENQDQVVNTKGGTPKVGRKSDGTSSVTTETMTDEFLQNTLLSQRGKVGSSTEENETVPSGWHLPQQLTTDDELKAFQQLCNAYIRHENDLLTQLLESANLSLSWADVILPIVHKVTEIVKPDVKHADDDMDIRQYVQFKKIPGGTKEDCRIVNGAVCSKNVSHRQMRTKWKAPRILLIGASIDYQRFENRFLSLEPLVMQESEYLRNTVSRLSSLSPNILVVEKFVSRLAQEFLLELGITVIQNVKSSVMERIARFTQGVIESSADMPIGRPQLGLCHNFYLETFTLSNSKRKTLMFFDGCATHLGCAVLLRGGSSQELVKVKKIISLMTLVAYNWRLERSFHIDMFAMPPDDQFKKSKSGFNFLNCENSSPESTVHSLTQSSHKSPSRSQTPEPCQSSNPSNSAEKAVLKSETCDDMSDPLQSSVHPNSFEKQNQANGDEELKLIVTNLPDPTESNVKRYSFRKCLNDVILSASPFINFELPYLETEEGKKCKLRSFFPEDIYWSSLLYGKKEDISEEESPSFNLNQEIGNGNTNQKMKNITPHAFILDKISEPLHSDHFQDLLSDFRRKGNTFKRLQPTVDSIKNQAKECCRNETDNRSHQLNEKMDALDPFKHQKLSVLLCSFSQLSSNFPWFCVNPWVVNMDMYGRNDISLGMFLERYCFRKTYLCPSKTCDQSMIPTHVRRFVHGDGCVIVALKELPKVIVGTAEHILMWNWCSTCGTVSPIVPMSAETWSLSFAKYLEIRFHAKQYTRRSHGNKNHCPHSLNHHNVQYFAQQTVVCSFKYSKIKLWEFCLPLVTLSVKKEPKTVAMLIEDVKTVAMTGHGLYANILESLLSLKDTSVGLRVEEVVKALLDHLKAEQAVFRSRIEDIQVNLTSPNVNAEENAQVRESFLWKVTDSIGFLRSFIADTVPLWNMRLQDAANLRKKEEKQAKSGKSNSDQSDIPSRSLSRMESDASIIESMSHATSTSSIPRNFEESLHADPNESKLDHSVSSMSNIDASITGALEALSRSPVPTIPTVLLNPLGLDEKGQGTKSPCPPSPNQFAGNNDKSRVDSSLRTSGEYGLTSEDAVDKTDRKPSAVKTLMSHFISQSGNVSFIQSPFPPHEHYFQMALTTMPIIVSENEPSSIVAFALCSNEYQTKRMELMKLSPQHNPPSTDSPKNFLPTDLNETSVSAPKKIKTTADPIASNDDFSSSYNSQKCVVGEDNIIYYDAEAEDKNFGSKTQSHIEVQFTSATAKFYCRIYFAEMFRKLRKLCISGGEEFYIRSISRCVAWAASGGKSGSNFCKTTDDRFVIKQMNKFEVESFLDIAPNYYKYVKSCFYEKKPTVLAKIIGVYRIGYKNSQNNTATKQDILVMENLFYKRNISRKFDLKGSIRNRLATANDKIQDLVLLDENLVNMACENPLYIRPHSKSVLTMAITNDTKFLTSQMVMDYSLLVGLDETNNELVIGIIDYIRTFTWDKKIEAFVKGTGILGGQGKTPTVISPDEYQSRFCEAMYRYFPSVPNKWMGLGRELDSNSS